MIRAGDGVGRPTSAGRLRVRPRLTHYKPPRDPHDPEWPPGHGSSARAGVDAYPAPSRPSLAWPAKRGPAPGDPAPLAQETCLDRRPSRRYPVAERRATLLSSRLDAEPGRVAGFRGSGCDAVKSAILTTDATPAFIVAWPGQTHRARQGDGPEIRYGRSGAPATLREARGISGTAVDVENFWGRAAAGSTDEGEPGPSGLPRRPSAGSRWRGRWEKQRPGPFAVNGSGCLGAGS